jgi:hypothetical protein
MFGGAAAELGVLATTGVGWAIAGAANQTTRVTPTPRTPFHHVPRTIASATLTPTFPRWIAEARRQGESYYHRACFGRAHAEFEELGEPLAVAHVRLAARHHLHMLRVHHRQLEAPLKEIVDGTPVLASERSSRRPTIGFVCGSHREDRIALGADGPVLSARR